MKNSSDIPPTSALRDNHARGSVASLFAESRSTRIGNHP